MKMATKPIHEIRIGRIRAAIWKNAGENGTRYTTSFSRLYKDGDNWRDASSFDRDDLLVVAKVADAVHSWIYLQQNQPADER
jgi:hypothetical protein